MTRSSDRARPMPASSASRRDLIRAALHTLRDEQRRFERLGFELPLARCHAEIRYWSFLAALHALPAPGRSGAERGDSRCDGPAAR